MTEPIVKVEKEPLEKEKKKKTPGRKKKVVEPMKITLLTTPLVLSFD
jgi:hypothetical protein